MLPLNFKKNMKLSGCIDDSAISVFTLAERTMGKHIFHDAEPSGVRIIVWKYQKAWEEPMKVWIQGDSQMSQFLRKICSSRGMVMSTPAACDLAVLNFPFSSINEELEKDFGKGQKIVCGMIDEKINRISEEKNWMLFQPLEDGKARCICRFRLPQTYPPGP